MLRAADERPRVDVERVPFAAVMETLRRGFESYVAYAMKLFGAPARAAAARQDKLRFALEQAHLPILAEAYIAATWLTAAIAGVALYTLVFAGLGLASAAGVAPTPALAAALLVLPLMGAATAYVAIATYPDYRAGERGRLIDRDIPYAVNYIAAMSSAGVVPAALLRELAREKTYGEVSREMAWIIRDIDVLGHDLLTALQSGIARSPSRRFQEFLQGAKTTILSGGDLKAYFGAKADQYMADNRRVQKEFLESLGLMAESYVTVVIAGPLFMIVMLSIMLVIGRSNQASELFLFFLIFVMLPVAHTGFSWVMRNLTPEA